MCRWLSYGSSTVASEPLQQLGKDAPIKPLFAATTRRLLREHRVAVVVAAQAEEVQAVALQTAAEDMEVEAAEAAQEAATHEVRARAGRSCRLWEQTRRKRVTAPEGREGRARERQDQQAAAEDAAAADAAQHAASLARAAQRARDVAEEDRQRRAAEQQRTAEAAQQEAALRASAMAAAAARQTAEAAAKQAAEREMERRSVGEILVGLLPEGARPTDASGECVSERTLNRKFVTGYRDSDSDTRGRLLNAAAVVVHTALEQLSPAPLQTAEELTREVRGVAHPDPLRLALSKARTDKPPRRRLLQLLAQSGMAQSLIVSYMAAVERKEKMAVRSGCTYYAYYGCTTMGTLTKAALTKAALTMPGHRYSRPSSHPTR